MCGKQAAQLFRDIQADWIIPTHFDAWNYFTQNGVALAKVFQEDGVSEQVKWLVPGEPVRIL
jgi:L-ascorbate metabolism protein UlaG (beta-lactamase superfamily)